MNNEEIKSRITEIEGEIADFEINPEDYEEEYQKMLDEISTIEIGNLKYTGSHVLKEVDPVAYICGLNNYVNGLAIEDDQGYKDLIEELEDLKFELDK